MASSADQTQLRERLESRERRQRTRAAVAAVLVGGIGMLIAVGPAYGMTSTAAGAVVAAVGGVTMVGLALLILAARVAPGRAAGRTRQVWGENGPALEVHLKRTLPWGRTLVAAGGAAFLAAGAVAIGGGGYVLLAPATLLALLAPDAIAAWGRHPVLRITAAGVSYHGWSQEAEIGWDDVDRVELENGSQPRVVVRARPGATSLRTRSRRIIHPVDRAVKGQGVAVPSVALDQPNAVRMVMRSLAGMPQAARAGYLERQQTLDHLLGGAGTVPR